MKRTNIMRAAIAKSFLSLSALALLSTAAYAEAKSGLECNPFTQECTATTQTQNANRIKPVNKSYSLSNRRNEHGFDQAYADNSEAFENCREDLSAPSCEDVLENVIKECERDSNYDSRCEDMNLLKGCINSDTDSVEDEPECRELFDRRD